MTQLSHWRSGTKRYIDHEPGLELRQLGSIVILNKPFKKIEVVQLAVALTAKWQIKQQSKLRVHSLEKLLHSLGSR
jgi:hypothetical protein